MTPSPFDAAGQLSDNRGLDMKQLVLAFALAAATAAAAAGCGKSSDLRPLKEETTGMVAGYAERVAALDQRKQDLLRRGGAARIDTGALLADVTRSLLPGLQALVQGAPAQIDGIEKNPKLDEQQKVTALRAYAVQAEEKLEDGWTLANARLDAAEIVISRAEGQARAQAAAPAPPTPAPAEPAPAGDAAGAAGGTYPAGAPQEGSAAANAAK